MADIKARDLIVRQLFPIPENVVPDGVKCIQLTIPDDMQHEAVFMGAVALLTKWNSWQKDGTTNARDAANAWKEALLTGIEACMSAVTDVRQNEETPCILEKQIDGGAWVEFADLQLCQPRIRKRGGTIQWFDGTNWVDMPDDGDDPMDGTIDPQWTDPPAGETGNCLAAENITALLQQQVTEWASALTAGAIALGIVTIITGVLTAFFVPFATPAILGFATTIIGIGASGLSSAFTTEVYDRFKCIVYLNAETDGSITVADYESIIDDVQSESGTAWDLIEVWLGFLGAVGLSRAAASAGITTGDCDSCDTIIGLSYSGGYGDGNASSMVSGQEITLTFTAGFVAGRGHIEITFDRCVDIEYISTTSTGFPEGDDWTAFDCPGGATLSGSQSFQNESSIQGISMWSSAPGDTVTLRVTAV